MEIYAFTCMTQILYFSNKVLLESCNFKDAVDISQWAYCRQALNTRNLDQL